MNSGITRRIDDLGRVVIPAETRRLFNIGEGDHLAFSVDGDSILIRKLVASCTFCGTSTTVAPFRGKGLCQSCSKEIRSIAFA